MAVLLGAAAALAVPQSPVASLTIPAGTHLELELTQRTRLHQPGQAITAYLTAPVYADNRVALPVGTEVGGSVVGIHGAAWWPRLQAAIGGDFSPQPQVTVRFNSVRLGNGSWLPLRTELAPDGPPLHMVTATQQGKTADLERRLGTMYHQQEDAAEALLKEQTHWASLKDEAVQSLPYRPASLPPGTHYGARLLAPVTVPDQAPPPPPQAPLPRDLPAGTVLHARLAAGLDSATTRWGTPVMAVVTAPTLAPDGKLLIPQGTRLEGDVVEVHPARHWGRGGKLRFVFTHLELPAGAQHAVTTRLAAAATSGPVRMSGEGEASAAPPGGVTPYIALGLTVATGLHADADNAWALNAGSGTHLRIWGTAMSTLFTRWRPVGLVLGFIGSGQTIYRRWLGRGPQVVFPADTALDIEITASSPHGPVLPH